MKLKPEQDLSCNEIEVIIKYPQKDRRVLRIIDFLQSFDMQIKCAGENAERMIHIMDILIKKSLFIIINIILMIILNIMGQKCLMYHLEAGGQE